MQGCQATGKSSKSQAGRARTVLRGTSCPQRRPVDQPPHPEGSHTTVVPFYPAPLLTSFVFLSTPPWPDTPLRRGRVLTRATPGGRPPLIRPGTARGSGRAAAGDFGSRGSDFPCSPPARRGSLSRTPAPG